MIKFKDKDLTNLIKPFSKKAALFSILNGMISALLVFFAYCTKNVINGAIENDISALWIILLCISGVSIPLLKGFTSYYVNKFTDEKSALIRSELYTKIFKKDSLKLSQLTRGEIYNRLMNDVRNCVLYYSSFLPSLVGEIVQLIAALALMVLIQPILGLIVLGLGIIGLLVMVCLRKLLKNEQKKVRERYDDVTCTVTDGVKYNDLVKSLSCDEAAASRLNNSQKSYLKNLSVFRFLSISFSSMFSFCVQVASIALVLYGAYLISDNTMSFGDYSALIELVALFKSPISALTSLQSSLAIFDASNERINDILVIPDDSREFVELKEKPLSIEFKNISFGYPNNELIIRNYSEKISLDKWIKLDGISGKGKSTLFKLLLGIYTPSEGEIVVNTEHKSYSLNKFRVSNLFSFVPQRNVLFSGTIYDNLRLTNSGLTKEEAKEILKIVNADFIEKTGIDYSVNDKGEGLSIGQIQRLCIARAIASKNPILLLDEFTSSLDKENSEIIIKNLTAKYPCCIFASHANNENIKDFKLLKF